MLINGCFFYQPKIRELNAGLVLQQFEKQILVA